MTRALEISARSAAAASDAWVARAAPLLRRRPEAIDRAGALLEELYGGAVHGRIQRRYAVSRYGRGAAGEIPWLPLVCLWSMHLEVLRAVWERRTGRPDALGDLGSGLSIEGGRVMEDLADLASESIERAAQREAVERIAGAVFGAARPGGVADPVGRAYQAIVPRRLRHGIGEYFTPPGLAGLAVRRAGVGPAEAICDPFCGTGAILAAHLCRTRSRARRSAAAIFGQDLSPLAVIGARLGISMLAGFDPGDLADRIRQGDSVAGPCPEPGASAAIVTNPPWISWANLSSSLRERYRRDVVPAYDAVPPGGRGAAAGERNDDLLVLAAIRLIDAWSRDGAPIVLIAKHTLLTATAHGVFRRGEVRASGRDAVPYAITRVDDLRAVSPFGIPNETAVITLVRGRGRGPGAPVTEWSRREGSPRDFSGRERDWAISKGRLKPSDPGDPESPWARAGGGLDALSWLDGPNPYEIRHGLKHDMGGVFFVRLTGRERAAPGGGRLVEVENRPARSRGTSLPGVRAFVEAEAVFPVLRSRHVRRWRIEGHDLFLAAQRRAGEGSPSELGASSPALLAYLERFRGALESRRSVVFRRGPFYGIWGLGAYTWSPHKVVWCSMGFRPDFAAIGEIEVPGVGRRPALADGALYTISAGSEEEALFLAGLLNSAPVGEWLAARSSRSKRGLGKALLGRLGLPRFDPAEPSHLALVAAAREAGSTDCGGAVEEAARRALAPLEDERRR